MKLGPVWLRTPVGHTIEPGLRKTVSGWQAYLKRDGKFLQTHFPKNVDIKAPRKWREQQIGRRQADMAPLTKTGPTFADDVRTYLSLITGLVTYKNRVGWMHAWVEALGASTSRADVTALHIRRALEHWRRDGLKPATLNLRRAALRHLWSTLDGRSAPNPVKDVPSYADPFTGWQLPTWPEAVKAVHAIDRGDIRIALTLFLWTGWPPVEWRRIRPDAVSFEKLEVTLQGRKKGRGTPLEVLPMLPQAAEALRAFLDAQGWTRTWHNATLGRALHRGCKAAGVPPFRVYDLRHIFGTKLATITKDDRVVAALMRHTRLTMTWRYTMGSVPARFKDVIAEAAKHFD
jgi:integrase